MKKNQILQLYGAILVFTIILGSFGANTFFSGEDKFQKAIPSTVIIFSITFLYLFSVAAHTKVTALHFAVSNLILKRNET